MKDKKTIIIDFDGTVCPSAETIITKMYPKYKSKGIIYRDELLDWDGFPYIDKEDVNWFINQFDSQEMYNKSKPYKNCIEVLTKLSKKYNIVFCTKTENPSTKIKKIYWLKKYFKFNFNVVFINDFIKSHVKGDIIIDDKLECLQGYRKLKIIYNFFKYNSHPIYDTDSQQFEDGSMITKAKDWNEVLSEIKYFEENIDKR